MDVNVELLTTEEDELTSKVRLIGKVTLFTTLILILISASSTNDSAAFNFFVWISLFLLVGSQLFLMIYHQGIKSIGKLTFSFDGLTLQRGENSKFYPLSDLREMKISLSEYAGEQNFMPFYLIVPTQNGVENFIWLNKSKLEDKLRFKIISVSHFNRLTDVIREWQMKYPTIEK